MAWRGLKLGSGARPLNDTTLIAASATIEGNMMFSGVLEIEGRVVGDIEATGGEPGVVRILPGGQIVGNVSAPVVVVNGIVSGNVFAREHVELASRAIVHGDVEYSLLEMTKGAQVNGRLVYREPQAVGSAAGSSPRDERQEPLVD